MIPIGVATAKTKAPSRPACRSRLVAQRRSAVSLRARASPGRATNQSFLAPPQPSPRRSPPSLLIAPGSELNENFRLAPCGNYDLRGPALLNGRQCPPYGKIDDPTLMPETAVAASTVET